MTRPQDVKRSCESTCFADIFFFPRWFKAVTLGPAVTGLQGPTSHACNRVVFNVCAVFSDKWCEGCLVTLLYS